MSGKKPSSSESPTQPFHTSGESSQRTAHLVVLRGPQAGKEFTINPGINMFGRQVGHIIRDVRVSRQHAYIQAVQGEYTLFDNQSTNGIFVNGERVDNSISLQHGDTIRMGDTILVLKLHGQGENDPSVIGARTPDLTAQNPNDRTILANRDSLTVPTRTDVPRYDSPNHTDSAEGSITEEDGS